MANVSEEKHERTTLFVKHMPALLTVEEKKHFFSLFGASNVRVMPIQGKLKHTAFVSFPSPEKAREALQRLHQLEILDCILSAEFAKKLTKRLDISAEQITTDSKVNFDSTKKGEDLQFSSTLKRCKFCHKLPPVAPHFGIEYPTNPGCRYLYPQPTADVLVNVCSALLTVPKFYTQVLHLMNKMNLYPPFGSATHIPPMLLEHVSQYVSVQHQVVNTARHEESESEYESHEETCAANELANKLPPSRAVTALKRKRHKVSSSPKRKLSKLKLDKSIPKVVSDSGKKDISAAFETPVESAKKGISISVPPEFTLHKAAETIQPIEDDADASSIPENKNDSDGFGKLPPISKQTASDHNDDNQDYNLTFDFVSQKQLERGRLSTKEMKTNPLFKNYHPGQSSCRLYIKNLSKKATDKDLRFIFGRFVNFNNNEEVKMFDIRVMTQGRMKGQAFVGMPNVKTAKTALEAVNGYQLIGKPMVVLFARSAAPKTTNH